MRFNEVAARLATLPVTLPDGPAELIPVIATTGERRPGPLPDATTTRPAAVLLLLYPDDLGDARIVLTERVDRGGHHSGEVSFPGGRAEPDDADAVATALREAMEEVGLDPVACGLRVVGALPPVWIPVSGYAVTPVVALAERRPVLRAEPAEVARIIEPSVASFLPGAELLEVQREIRGWELRYAAYPIEGLAVWGMTARVLGGLGAHLGEATRHPGR